MSRQTGSESARDRILNTAAELFYSQGYRATGINEVIEKSKVAKATFYSHFATKDELCLAYLKALNSRELQEVRAFVAQKRSPRARFLAVIESLGPWLEQTGMRGCGYLNMAAEIPESGSVLRKIGKGHYRELQLLVEKLAVELIDADPKRYSGLDSKQVAVDYMVIFTGVIALTVIHHETWPIKQGIQMVKKLID